MWSRRARGPAERFGGPDKGAFGRAAGRGRAQPELGGGARRVGAGPGERGRSLAGGGGAWRAGRAVPRTPEASERAGGCGRRRARERVSEPGSGAGRAMGRRAAGTLLLALLLHGRLLAVSVRGGGRLLAAPANLSGAPEIAGPGFRPGTAAPF